MKIIILLVTRILFASALNLEYLDPVKLQTKTPASIQQAAASGIISRYMKDVIVEVNPVLFSDHKDVFSVRTLQGRLSIRGSTGVAVVWGFNYYLKKYLKGHFGWENQRVNIPDKLPEVDEVVQANDRFRFYQNVCTASYSFVWWNSSDWKQHVEWMALNGINLALAPVAQEAAWTRIYRQLGLTENEIDEHFTGPAFLSWNRMGNVRGWGGPLTLTWHDSQKEIQNEVYNYMLRLGIIPVLPAFNGHVPIAFNRVFPNISLHFIETWHKFNTDYCCGAFLDPKDLLFKKLGKMFHSEITNTSMRNTSHIYSTDPLNEVRLSSWSTAFVKITARAIYEMLIESDNNSVWLMQNWLFYDSKNWSMKDRVKAFVTSVPNGRMLILDLQSEQRPQYEVYQQYYGQPFIWCMLHNFGGTHGMFGNMKTINQNVYKARSQTNSTMIGVGLTPEGINQNYVVYELMLESAWRPGPVNLTSWVAEYAERRYGCNDTALAWRFLLDSIYSFNGTNRIRGKYVVTRRPSLRITPWAWYKSRDLIQAFRVFIEVSNPQCYSSGFHHDLVDITRQALQYRAEQLYISLKNDQFSSSWVFNASMNIFLDAMLDMEKILRTNLNFSIKKWLAKARSFARTPEQAYIYELNARNQITLWGPNGEISDYACKQWAEMFHYYYIPRWTMFLNAFLASKVRGEIFNEASTRKIVRATVEREFQYVQIESLPAENVRNLSLALYQKWAHVPDLQDLPINVLRSVNFDNDFDGEDEKEPPLVTTTSQKPVSTVKTTKSPYQDIGWYM